MAYGGQAPRRSGRRLRYAHSPDLHGRSHPHFLSWRAHVFPRDFHQRRHPARIHSELWPLRPAGSSELANQAAPRSAAAAYPGCRCVGHGGKPPVARHEKRNDDVKVLLRTSRSRAEAHERLAWIVEGIQYAQRKAYEGDLGSIPGDPLKSSGEGPWGENYKPTPPVLRTLIVALGVQFFQTASGMDATIYYSPVTFKKARLKSESAVLGATIAVGVAKAGFVVVAAFLIDTVGRRPLLLTSTIGSAVSLLTLALALEFTGRASGAAHHVAAYLAVVATCGNVAFFSIGMGPVNWLLGPEIFPLRLRAKAASLGVAVNRTMSGVLSISFLSVTKAIMVPGTFFLFAAVSGLSAAFIYVYVPETKGKTLEEIVEYFHMKHSEKTSNPSELELADSQAGTQTTTVTLTKRTAR